MRGEAIMKQLARAIGDRELAWILLVIVGLIVFGAWGLEP